MSIAIFGGTFDPIHFGHLLIAEESYHKVKIEKVIFMPAGNPPHKVGKSITSAKHRLKMLKLAIADNKHFSYSTLELKKSKTSYTVDTFRFFQKNYNKDIYFIIGADSLLDMPNWKDAKYLLKNANFIVARRPNFSVKKLKNKDFFRPYIDNIYLMNSTLVEISSSLIRENVRKNKFIKYMTPEPVIEYIKENKLYLN